MSDLEENFSSPTSSSTQFANTKRSIYMPTFRLFVNLITNICIVITVLICLLYSCQTKELGDYELHIILCVLGYQLFMSQGILVLSDSNSWSLYVGRLRKRTIHIVLQIIGIILIIVGSAIMIKHMERNFTTCHGIFGLCALILALITFINGIMATYASKIRQFCSVFWIKYSHYITGVATLFCGAICLCYGFDKFPFRRWINNDNGVYVLMALTALFTVSVSVEFWIYTANRLGRLL